MTTFSYSQQQLLAVLQITPVKLTDVFAEQRFSDSCISADSDLSDRQVPVDAAACAVSTHQTVSDIVAPDLSHLLAQDIQLALADDISWYMNVQADVAELKDNQLITAALSKLRDAAAKKALWQLLSTHDEN